MKIYLIGDTHFGGSKKSESFGYSPDYEKRILEGLKSTVKEGDIVIHLGNIADTKEKPWVEKMMKASHTKNWILVHGAKEKIYPPSKYLNLGFMLVINNITVYAKRTPVLVTSLPFCGSRHLKDNALKNLHGGTYGNARKESFINPDYDTAYHTEISLVKNGYKPIELDKFSKGIQTQMKKVMVKGKPNFIPKKFDEGHNDD